MKLGKSIQLELFGKARKSRVSTDLMQIAECCWAGYRAGRSVTEIAARMGIRRTQAAGLALMYQDDELCAVLQECDSIPTFFSFLEVSPKIRETVLRLLGNGKITRRLLAEATRKHEQKAVVRKLKLFGGRGAKRDGSCIEKNIQGELGEGGERFYPGFFKMFPTLGFMDILGS